MKDSRISDSHYIALTKASELIPLVAQQLLSARKAEQPEYGTDEYIKMEYWTVQSDRLLVVLESLSPLFQALRLDLSIEFSIGILLRSALFDVCQIQYVLLQALKKCDVVPLIKNINTEQLGHYIDHKERLVDERVLKNQAFIEEIKHLYDTVGYMFDKEPVSKGQTNHKKVGSGDRLSTKKIRGALIEAGKVQTSEFGRPLFRIEAIYLFEYYSKYEHYGLIGAHLRKSNLAETLVNRIFHSTYLILTTLVRTTLIVGKDPSGLLTNEIVSNFETLLKESSGINE